MIEKLEELTTDQFIDLISGDATILLHDGDTPDPIKLTIAMRNIVMEYKQIADPTGAKQYMVSTERLMKAHISEMVFTMCNALVVLGEYAKAKEIMNTYGLRVANMSDKRVKAEVTSRLNRAKADIAALQEEMTHTDGEDRDVRATFAAQTASLMAHFKFQIDTATMKANIYAHLVARHNNEIKAQLKALKK